VEILFEDEDLIAVTKPAGLPSHSTRDPGRPHVVLALKKQFPEHFSDGGPYLHHRLDVDTSGVMILAKSKRSNAPLTELFRRHQIQKTYFCLSLRQVRSLPLPAADSAPLILTQFLAPLGKVAGKMQMSIVRSGGDKAVTEFRLMESLAHFDFIEARPLTGRTHQIRVQIASLERPIVGDNLYGGKSSSVPRLMLHAARLELIHPWTQKALCFEAPLPSDFRKILERERQQIGQS